MYLVFVMAVYFTLEDVRLIRGAWRWLKARGKKREA